MADGQPGWYAENISDCRRMQQLQYFGEVFDTSKCGKMRNTKCDNCYMREEASIEKVDITETAKALAQAVFRLSNCGNWNAKNFTLNHLVDIWRGIKAVKVIAADVTGTTSMGRGATSLLRRPTASSGCSSSRVISGRRLWSTRTTARVPTSSWGPSSTP